MYLSPLDQEHMHTSKKLPNKALFGRGQWSQPAWDRLNHESSVETGMVRKPLPEPGADSGLPQEVALTWEIKLKITQSFWQYQLLWIFVLFCFEALVFRHSTKHRDEKNHQTKKSSYLLQLEEYFSSNFIHTWLWNSELTKYLFSSFCGYTVYLWF